MSINAVPDDAIYCTGYGGYSDNSSSSVFECCTFGNWSSDTCSPLFAVFDDSDYEDDESECDPVECFKSCQDPSALYKDAWVKSGTKNPAYQYCAAFPTLYAYARQDLLPSNATIIPAGINHLSDDDLRNITDTVTHCLITTCDQSQDPNHCASKCSPSALLVNSTTPSLQGISGCFDALCHSSKPVPFPNADILGIGVGLLQHPP